MATGPELLSAAQARWEGGKTPPTLLIRDWRESDESVHKTDVSKISFFEGT